jgi:hypothetical protein
LGYDYEGEKKKIGANRHGNVRGDTQDVRPNGRDATRKGDECCQATATTAEIASADFISLQHSDEPGHHSLPAGDAGWLFSGRYTVSWIGVRAFARDALPSNPGVKLYCGYGKVLR